MSHTPVEHRSSLSVVCNELLETIRARLESFEDGVKVATNTEQTHLRIMSSILDASQANTLAFDSADKQSEAVRQKIEAAIEKSFGNGNGSPIERLNLVLAALGGCSESIKSLRSESDVQLREAKKFFEELRVQISSLP